EQWKTFVFRFRSCKIPQAKDCVAMLWSSAWKQQAQLVRGHKIRSRYTASGETRGQKAPAISWPLRESAKPSTVDETKAFHRPPVAPLRLGGKGSTGSARHSQGTPRSAPRNLSAMRMSWPSLEIGRGDVEALDWWFYEIESRLSHAAPDARCLYPWLRQAPSFHEVEKELSSPFTFKNFKEGWNFSDSSSFSAWYEEQATRSSHVGTEVEMPHLPSSETKLPMPEGAFGGRAGPPESEKPRMGTEPRRVSSGSLRQPLAAGDSLRGSRQCHSAR
ncbi:unnamed protein product, partial [Effrenium voratum]